MYAEKFSVYTERFSIYTEKPSIKFFPHRCFFHLFNLWFFKKNHPKLYFYHY